MSDQKPHGLDQRITETLVTRAQDVDQRVGSRVLDRLSSELESPSHSAAPGWRIAVISGLAAALVLIALTPVMISTIGGNSDGGSDSPPSGQPAVGEPVSLSGEALDGEPISTDDYLGQPLVLTLWGSWCKPCRDQVTELSEIGGIQILGVSIGEVGRANAEALASRDGLTFPTLFGLDEPSSATLEQVDEGSYPATLLLDARGQISRRWTGPVEASTISDAVERLQANQPVALLLSRTDAVGRDAHIRGPLRLLGNCAGIGDSVAIWPTGTTVVRDDPLVLNIPGMGDVESGEELEGGGGYFDTATDNVLTRLPQSCGTTRGVTFRLN